MQGRGQDFGMRGGGGGGGLGGVGGGGGGKVGLKSVQAVKGDQSVIWSPLLQLTSLTVVKCGRQCIERSYTLRIFLETACALATIVCQVTHRLTPCNGPIHTDTITSATFC